MAVVVTPRGHGMRQSPAVSIQRRVYLQGLSKLYPAIQKSNNINQVYIYTNQSTQSGQNIIQQKYLIRIPTTRPTLKLYNKTYLGSYTGKLLRPTTLVPLRNQSHQYL